MHALSTYEVWRFKQVDAAVEEKSATPPLLETNYELVSKWAKKMKEKLSRVQRDGAFNTESSQLSIQLKSFTPTSSSLENLNMGEATAAADLSVTVQPETDLSAVTFTSPTSKKVQEDMEVMVSKPPQMKKLKKAPQSKEDEKLRMEVARKVMDRHNINADVPMKGRRRCAVCGVRIKGFYFNAEHGVSTEEDGIPHLNTGEIKFCPLADDHSIYHSYLEQKIEEKAKQSKRHYESRRGSGF